MKINPVTGTPTISNTPNTGLSPQRLAHLKNIAAGQMVEEQDPNQQRQPLNRAIQMKTNYTISRDVSNAPPEQVISDPTAMVDNSVQATAVSEATEPLSPQLAAIARQRRALQVKERELAEKMKAFDGPTRAELEARIKSQPLSVLQELGVTYDQLTNDILSSQGGNNADYQALKSEMKALREGVDKTLSDKDAAAEKAVLQQMRSTVNQLSMQGDDFELIRETQSQPDVIELIHRTYKQTGEVMDEVEAMKLIEEELVRESLKIAQLKKVQGKLTPQVPLQPQANQGIRTLTNKDNARPMMDRRQRAILAMQGQLKR